MLNEMLDGVSQRLNELFGTECQILTERVGQDARTPYFLVKLSEALEKPGVGLRAFWETRINIQYIPKETDKVSREVNQTAELLLAGMETITLKDGSLLRGSQKGCRIGDGGLDFSVNYNVFVNKEQQKEVPMETIEIKKGLVK